MPSRTAEPMTPHETAGQPPARRLIVTIDGPGGVGKSTVAKLLAKALGLMYLDTGATYRALAYAALQQQLNPVTDVGPLTRIARRLPLELEPLADGALRVALDGQDITTSIRTERISEAAAQLSQHPAVREAMVELQRRLASQHGVVVEGRDTGSVVFPGASHKFFLEADASIRAERRQRELGKFYGTQPPLAEVQEKLELRDGLDRTRRVGPLVKPPGAIVIDTSHLTVQEVVKAMVERISGSGSTLRSFP